MSGQGFPWTIFNSNTLRPMMVDVLRAAGHEHAGSTGNRMKKEESLALLRKVEEHGLDAALKDFPIEPDGASASASASASTSKRKHQAPAQDDASAEPARKRGRARQTPAAEEPAAPRTRSKASDSRQGLLTRRQAAQARGDNLPPTRSWRASTSARQPRKPSQKAVAGSSSISAPLPAKPKPNSKAQVFDGVVLIKRPESYAGKGKAREQTQELEEEGGSDEDADGEVVEDGVEIESSSLENSNKENDPTFLGIANAETDGEVDAEGEDIIPVEEIGSPAPQITVEPTDDQIEDERNHDVAIEIGSPAPEIHIEPMADDGTIDGIEIEFEPANGTGTENENGYSEQGGLLRPRINTHLRAGSVELNPEYSIEVFSPTSAQHDSDDEMWGVAGPGVNGGLGPELGLGLGAPGAGLGPLDALD